MNANDFQGTAQAGRRTSRRLGYKQYILERIQRQQLLYIQGVQLISSPYIQYAFAPNIKHEIATCHAMIHLKYKGTSMILKVNERQKQGTWVYCTLALHSFTLFSC